MRLTPRRVLAGLGALALAAGGGAIAGAAQNDEPSPAKLAQPAEEPTEVKAGKTATGDRYEIEEFEATDGTQCLATSANGVTGRMCGDLDLRPGENVTAGLSILRDDMIVRALVGDEVFQVRFLGSDIPNGSVVRPVSQEGDLRLAVASVAAPEVETEIPLTDSGEVPNPPTITDESDIPAPPQPAPVTVEALDSEGTVIDRYTVGSGAE